LEGDFLVIEYNDNGVGVPPENKERVFNRGFGSNTGLGLFLIREILKITSIEISETGEKGVRFEMRVPYGRYRIDN
jgi:signal transduction histidine kinase